MAIHNSTLTYHTDDSQTKVISARVSLENKRFDQAFTLIEDLFLNVSPDEQTLREACAIAQELLLTLDQMRSEALLDTILLTLKQFPSLHAESAPFLERYGRLFLEKEPSQDHLMTAMRSFTVAYSLQPAHHHLHSLMSRCFHLLAVLRLREQLQKPARLENTQPFEDLLNLIPLYHNRFSQYPQDIQSLYRVARETYQSLNPKNKKLLSPFLNKIVEGENCEVALSNPPLTQTYRRYLAEIRSRYLDPTQDLGWIDFFRHLIEDAIFLLGKPPCLYDIRGVGSLAREEMCPYSDLEYFILIEDEQHRSYFKKLAQILDLQILSLGETDPKFQALFLFGQRFGLEIDHQANPATHDSLIGTPSKLFSLKEDPSPDDLKAFDSRLSSISLHSNHTFEPPVIDRHEIGKALYNMQRGEFAPSPIFQGQESDLKSEFVRPLIYFLKILALHAGIAENNIQRVIEQLPHLNALSKKLLKEVVSAVYAIRVRIHLAEGRLQETAALVPLHGLTALLKKEKQALEQAYHLAILPLHTLQLEDENIDLLEIALRNPSPIVVRAMARFLAPEAFEVHIHYYKKLNAPDQTALQQIYLDHVPEPIARRLAEIPNRAGYRQSMRLDEENLTKMLESLLTDSPVSGVKVRCPLLKQEFYLTKEAADTLLENNHIKKVYKDSLHNVNHYGPLHFKELPYQPLMEYAIYSLTSRIMGKATPATTLARFEVNGIAYPVLISETIVGEKLQNGEQLDPVQLTCLRLCEVLTKPGDGRFSNYIVSNGQVFCIDNDISFVEPVISEWSVRGILQMNVRRVTFRSTLFTLGKHPFDSKNLDYPLSIQAIEQFCTLEPDFILNDWLKEIQEREKIYTGLFSEAELKVFYELDKDRRFSPSLLLARGTIATLCMQFYHLQDALRIKKHEDPLLLLQEIISLNGTEKNPVGLLVERRYRKALMGSPFEKRLEKATSSRTDESLTSAQAMQIQFQTVPTLQEVQGRGIYSLEDALDELLLIEVLRLWNHIFVIQNGQEYKIEADFSGIQDVERQKLMLKTLAVLYKVKAQKPTSIALRHTQALDFDLLATFLHPDLKFLDLSFCPGLPDGYTVSTSSWIGARSPMLEELHLEGCPGIKSFDAPMVHLKGLNLDSCAHLVNLNTKSPQLEWVRINECPKLTQTDFPIRNDLNIFWAGTPNSTAMQALEWLKRLEGLSEIDLRRDINNDKLLPLAKALAVNTSLTSLNLSKNYLGPPFTLASLGAASISIFTANEGNAKIFNFGCLTRSLEINESITTLDLSNCEIDNFGARFIGKFIENNSTLVKIDLSFNKIGGIEFDFLGQSQFEQRSFGGEALAKAFQKNTTLTSVDLSDNEFVKNGVHPLVEAIKVNFAITSFNIKNNSFSDLPQDISDCIDRNQILQKAAFQEAQAGNDKLIGLGVSIYGTDPQGNTFLHVAALHGHAHLIVLLLEKAKNPTFMHWKNQDGKTALDLARENSHLEVVDLIVQTDRTQLN